MIFVTALAALAANAIVEAGSERLVMVMSPAKMLRQQLVHLQLQDPEGRVLLSDILKRLQIRDGDCATGRLLQMPEDYRYGYSPPLARKMGLYLPPQTWRDHDLCLVDRQYGRLILRLGAEDAGQSVTRRFP